MTRSVLSLILSLLLHRPWPSIVGPSWPDQTTSATGHSTTQPLNQPLLSSNPLDYFAKHKKTLALNTHQVVIDLCSEQLTLRRAKFPPVNDPPRL